MRFIVLGVSKLTIQTLLLLYKLRHKLLKTNTYAPNTNSKRQKRK
jgi:hypothetical protein